ncbi:hypothetical protein XHC_3664, partial [Xanthomonas hortorum pv. carotae str. M081]
MWLALTGWQVAGIAGSETARVSPVARLMAPACAASVRQ